MIKFVIMTRGRTGSTAIMDELNYVPQITAAQEIFTDIEYNLWATETLENVYPDIPPYLYWLGHQRALSICRRTPVLNSLPLPRYFKHIEGLANTKNSSAFGFKALSHHITHTKHLKDVLRKRDYRILYLTRNLPRQVISGMTAKIRGVYNAKNCTDDKRYELNTVDYVKLLRIEQQAVKNDKMFIEKNDFPCLHISYEEFIDDRGLFFERIFKFMGQNYSIPTPTNYSVMINELEHTI